MDPIQLLIAVIGVLSLPLGYLAWKAHKNGVSITDELKLLRPALRDHAEALAGHAFSLETHAEAVKQAAQPNVPGVTIDPQPNTIVIRHEFTPPPAAPPAAPPQAAAAPATADPVSIFLGNDTGGPVRPRVEGRDAMRDGPTIVTPYISAHRPELLPKGNRIIQWWAASGSTIDEAMKVCEEDKDQPEAYQALAAGQRLRDEQANVAGIDFKGHVDVARLTLDDGFYLSAMAGRFAALTRQGSIWTAMLYGSANACNAFINMINSTNAGRLGTFDPNTYQGQMKALVEATIGGSA